MLEQAEEDLALLSFRRAAADEANARRLQLASIRSRVLGVCGVGECVRRRVYEAFECVSVFWRAHTSTRRTLALSRSYPNLGYFVKRTCSVTTRNFAKSIPV